MRHLNAFLLVRRRSSPVAVALPGKAFVLSFLHDLDESLLQTRVLVNKLCIYVSNFELVPDFGSQRLRLLHISSVHIATELNSLLAWRSLCFFHCRDQPLHGLGCVYLALALRVFEGREVSGLPVELIEHHVRFLSLGRRMVTLFDLKEITARQINIALINFMIASAS